MKFPVNPLFYKLYNDYFADSKNDEPATDIQKWAVYNFHYKGFLDWLSRTFKKEVTPDSFPDLCNQKNFKKYFAFFIKTKDTKENFEKFKIIEDEVQINEKLVPVTSHEYDIDIVKAYFKLEKMLPTVEFTKSHMSREEYLQFFRYPIECYCKYNGLPFKSVFEAKYPIIVDSTMHGFEVYLGRTIITFDIHKIEAILRYQNSKWKGEGDFLSLVEHGVYNFVKNNSAFDNEVRLSKIMEWVEKKKDLDIKPKHGGSFFVYWPYEKEKLSELYDALLINRKIEENAQFADSFEFYEVLPKNKTVWQAPQVQLMYLLYLIYKKKDIYNGIPLHKIGTTLFKKSPNDFTVPGLNTTFTQIRPLIDGNKKLSKNLKSIEEIFNKLQLS